MNDLKFALRQLLKNPGFTAVAVLTLAFAIGATTAIYSVVRSTLLAPIPVPDADRLMIIETSNTKENSLGHGINPFVFAELRDNPAIFSNLALYDSAHAKFKDREFMEVIPGARVSPGFFSLWRIPPAMGRLFTADDGDAGAEKVVILSTSFWKRLGADPEIVGKPVELSGDFLESPAKLCTVVGVMPPYFRFPGAAEFWRPGTDPEIGPASANQPRMQYWFRNHRVVFRLPPGVEAKQAQAVLDTISARHTQDQPLYNEGWQMSVLPVTRLFADEQVRRTLWTLFTMIGLLWMIACANMANLLIARAEARRHEMAVRSALGAGRMRLIKQLLTESLLLAFLGGLAGLILTTWGIHTLDAFVGGLRMQPFELNWSVFASSMGLSLVTGIVFGLLPAWRASRPRLQETLKQTGASTTQTAADRYLARGLIVGEVALAVVIMFGAGLMLKSVSKLLNVDVGFKPEGLITLHVMPPLDKYRMGDRDTHTEFINRLKESLSAIPGVQSVGISTGWSGEREYVAATGDSPLRIAREGCGMESANPFLTMGVPLIEGRFLDRTDRAQDTIVINEKLAHRLWPGESAVGKQIHSLPLRDLEEEKWTVVGVVGNQKQYALDQELKPVFYRPSEEAYGSGRPTYFVLRSLVEPVAMIRPIQSVVKAVEPNAQKPSIRIVADDLRRSSEGRRRYTLFLTLFAGVGLALAIIGIYGLLAFSVARQVREIGIRMALGATARMICGLLVGEGIRLAIVGALIGMGGALAAARLLRSQLFEVSPYDPVVLLLASVLLMAVTLAACLIPALRAAKLDPIEALRHE